MIFVDVIGHIWQPGVGLCCYSYRLPAIGNLNRKNVKEWLDKNAGDFQEIVDFCVPGKFEWQNESSKEIWDQSDI